MVGTQKIMRKESKHATKGSHQTTQEENKKIRRGQRNSKTDRKQQNGNFVYTYQ